MDIHQLKTFVAVAREGSITRASETLHLSQPAVSAHIKALEEALGVALFERTARGMTLTAGGERLLAKAEGTIAAHRELMDEATRIKGRVAGKLRLGAGGNAKNAALARLVTRLAERFPDVEVAVEHGSSQEILAAVRAERLDAGFYNEASESDPLLATLEVATFGIHVVAPRGLVAAGAPLDWKALSEHPWIYPTSSACCGQTAERLFKTRAIRPKRVISVDREPVTRSLVASGAGVGLLHSDTADEAQAQGEIDRLFECDARVRVLFASLASRADDPLLAAAQSILRDA